ncbi:hypothetical protein [Streptomyces sp. NPDC049813]|uniref:hypothetical protein n=1 Tax=Streptomyces sp. NPDC049813 TaxID=3365597 RepID=UPI0037A3C661
MRIRRQLLFAAVAPLAIGVAASTACADPRPPAGAAASTRTASVVTELSAQEISLGDRATLQVRGRLVEGDTLLFPLSQMAVAVEVRGEQSTTPQRCNTTTSREGRFSCTFSVTAHDATTATVTFPGNALFAPGRASTTVAGPGRQGTPAPATPAAPAKPAASAAPAAPAKPAGGTLTAVSPSLHAAKPAASAAPVKPAGPAASAAAPAAAPSTAGRPH